VVESLWEERTRNDAGVRQGKTKPADGGLWRHGVKRERKTVRTKKKELRMVTHNRGTTKEENETKPRCGYLRENTKKMGRKKADRRGAREAGGRMKKGAPRPWRPQESLSLLDPGRGTRRKSKTPPVGLKRNCTAESVSCRRGKIHKTKERRASCGEEGCSKGLRRGRAQAEERG